MNNNDHSREDMARAYSAVQAHVLPGLGDAWEEAGPAVIMATQYALIQLAIDSRLPLSDLVDFIGAFNVLQRSA